MITTATLRDHLICPHRPVLDASLPITERDAVGAFTEMLWAQAAEHTKDTITSLGVTADLSEVPMSIRELATMAAMKRREPLIYGGRLGNTIESADPCLLALNPDGSYAPGDIRAGSGLESGDDDEPDALKAGYAIPLAHAAALIDEMGFGNGKHMAFVIDKDGVRVDYDLDQPRSIRNVQTWMAFYGGLVGEVRHALRGESMTLPALGASCKQCHWMTRCKSAVIEGNDLSLIPELGRNKRDAMRPLLPTVKALAAANLNQFREGKKKTVFPGVGIDSLKKFQERAQLLSMPNAQPYLKSPVELPRRSRDVYFDIESDPFKSNFVYLHGFVERNPARRVLDGAFKPFFADGVSPSDEEAMFAGAWAYLTERLADSVIYHYSQFEVTAYKQLARKYPGVCSVEDVKEVFSDPAVVDLYAVVKRHTVWPCYDFSIKTLATFCGFRWRDESPSGANSVEWYRRWLETGDEAIKARLLEYNADDNFGTGYVVDTVRGLELKAAA